MPAIPVPSSTVVLLRDDPSGLEVLLLVRRAKGSDPFSGASVFPGGILEEEDEHPAFTPVESGFEPRRASSALGEAVPEQMLRALYVAACRELYEEAGILIARDGHGELAADELLERFEDGRRRLHEGHRNLLELLERAELTLALDSLVPFARWITPEAQPKRWDTRFFLASAPPRQTARSDELETTSAVWIHPRAALDAYLAGTILLAPPTFRVLEELAALGDTAEAFASAETKGPPQTILPVPLVGSDVPTLLYPGDGEYPGATGTGRNRLILHEGRWQSVRGGA